MSNPLTFLDRCLPPAPWANAAARWLTLAAIAAFLALPPSLWPATPGSAATANETRRIAWAYYVPYAPNSLASLRRHAAQIDVLSAHWYGIDRNGTLCSCREAADKNQAQVIQIARANGVKIVPMVLNFDQGAEFSMVLNDPEMKAKAIGSLLAELDKQGWDGIQIDFEGLEFSDRGAMTAFMAEIAPLVRGRGKIISQALAAKTFDRPAGWAAGFDYAALAPYADYFTIMTYAYGEETPRSTQPFNWVDASISFAASQIPPEKLLMGVGWYGHAWNHTTKAIGSITWAQAQEHRRAGGATPQWDPIQRAWSFSYSLEGSDYTVWFEDRRSQDERLALMGRYGLGGAAFWRLGQEDPESWDSFAGMFSKPGTVQAPPPPYGALWGDHQIIARLPAWGLNPSSVTVTNTSDRTWTATGGIAFKLGYFWQNAAGDARVEGPGMEVLSSLPRDVPPGATVLVPFQIQAPPTPGAYLLRLDMVQDDGAWFSRRAKDTARVMKVAVTVTPAATAAPGQLAPLDSAALERFDTELRWQTPPGATQVQIQVTPADRDGPAINLIRTATDRFVLPRPVLGSGNYTLLPGMTYIWRVRTTGFGGQAEETHPGWGAWSALRSFRTPVATSASISAVSPAPGAKVSGAAASVQWTDLNPAVFYYEVQVSPDPRFNTDPAQATAAVWWNLVHGGQTAPLNSWRMPPLEPGVTYYWRVRPRLQGDATPALWSASWSFIAE